jgi:transposase InsO family protein
MKIKLHKLAKTTPALREEIRKSSLSGPQLARKHSLSIDTIYKWKKREDVRDLPHVRHNLGSKISEVEEEIIKELRGKLGLSVDDITEVMRRCIRGDISRSGIYRAIKRCGVERSLPEANEENTPQESVKNKQGLFEEVKECGYIHMDVKYLTKLEGKRSYVYAAIDRFSRYVYIEVLYDMEPRTAAGFVERFIEHFPHKVIKIITDNGFEWTDRCSGGVKEKATGNHPVDIICSKHEIKHKLTRIRRPQTNGMIERFNRRINEAIASKAKIANNSGRNSFYSHEERNEFIRNFVNSYNNTRLRCLNYNAPLSLLHSNLKEYNTKAGIQKNYSHPEFISGYTIKRC